MSKLEDYFFDKGCDRCGVAIAKGYHKKLAGREDFTVRELWQLCEVADLDPLKAFMLHVADRKEAE